MTKLARELGCNVLKSVGSIDINVPYTGRQYYDADKTTLNWLVEAGGEDYGDYKIARFDLYSSAQNSSDSSRDSIEFTAYQIKEEGWKICHLGDFDIYSITCSPPRFVRQLNDSRQLRAVTITIKYNERSD